MNRLYAKNILCVFICLLPIYANPASLKAEEALPLICPNYQTKSATADRIYQATQMQARYILSLIRPWEENRNLLLLNEGKSSTRRKSGEHWIRPQTGAIAGLAFLYHFGPYDEKIVGKPRQELLNEIIVPMIKYLTTTHLTGSRPTSDGKKWGHAWQSAHWTHMLGRGAWWIWDSLPGDAQRDVQRVVRDEAERIASSKPVYRIQNDTKSEENAWNSQILSIAILLMPNDRRRPVWEREFQKWAMSSFLRPSDATSDKIVDGKPVSEQFGGANIYDDYTLENHGIVHPEYMKCFTISLGCTLDYILSARKAPDALLYNAAGIYENLKWFALPDGGLVYPSGSDWELFRNPRALQTHITMATFGGDPEAWSLAMNCLDTLERMQARSPSGQIFLDAEYFFPSTQTDILYALAKNWLMIKCTHRINSKPKSREGVLRLNYGKIILNRTRNSIHTLSWGKKIMVQFIPLRLDRVVSPHQRSGIGAIYLRGKKDPLPVKVHKVSVNHNANSFTAVLVVDHGKNKIRAYLKYRSCADGTWIMSEKLVAMDDIVTKKITTGLIGILNNRSWVYERGTRNISFRTADSSVWNSTPVPSCRGTIVRPSFATMVNVDNAFTIQSPRPLRAMYLGALKPIRARVTDELYLNAIIGNKKWRKGQVISEFDIKISTINQNEKRTEGASKTRKNKEN